MYFPLKPSQKAMCVSLSNQAEAVQSLIGTLLSQTEADTGKAYIFNQQKSVMCELSLLYLQSSLEIKSSLYHEEKHQDGKISSLDPVDQ